MKTLGPPTQRSVKKSWHHDGHLKEYASNQIVQPTRTGPELVCGASAISLHGLKSSLFVCLFFNWTKGVGTRTHTIRKIRKLEH